MTAAGGRPSVLLAVAALTTALGARPAAAQGLDRPGTLRVGPIAVVGDVSIVAGRADDTAFFNYTDYEQNALRGARIRLGASWSPIARLTIAGETRAENFDRVELSGLYVRWQPWTRRALTVQAGRIPPVIGAFARRAYGRDNILAGTPLPYQYLTSLRPDALPITTQDLVRMRARGWRPSYPLGEDDIATGIPLVNTARWDTGVQASYRAGWFELAGAVTRGAAAVPAVRDRNDGLQWSGRAALASPRGVTIGASMSRGNWIDRAALDLVPAARREQDHQTLWGVDVEYGGGPLLARAELLRSTFELPMDGAPLKLSALGGFGELRWRLTPRWQLAGRVERLSFSRTLPSAGGAMISWDAPVTRVEGAVGVRLSRRIDARAGWQHNWRTSGRSRPRTFPFAQLLYWF